MHAPSTVHWQAVKRLLRYLKQTMLYGLKITHSATSELKVYSDANWAGDQINRTLTLGYVLYFGNNTTS